MSNHVITPAAQFGYWTVLHKVQGSKYLCECQCGTQQMLYRSSLLLGKSVSCGCLRRSRTPNTGDRVADWTVISRSPGSRMALCRCVCGEEREVEIYTLGKTSVSCGHARRARVAQSETTKVCNSCHQEKSLSEFHRDKVGVKGRRPYCKDCVKTTHQKNSIEVNARSRARYREDPASKNRKTSEYRKKNPIYGTTRGRVSKGGGTWVGDITVAGLDRLLGRYEHACYICFLVLDDLNPVSWDHYQPLARGGDHSLANLRPACAVCNKMKNASWPVTETLFQYIRETRRSLSPPPGRG